MPQYFLGVDGGQSSTTALIGDSTGRVLGAGRAGPCNHVRAADGHAKFTRVLRESLEAACAQAGLSPATRFASAFLGFSGGPEDKEELLKEILSSDRLAVTHDASIALSGATAGEPGLVTIAGTGSIAFGRNPSGQTARAGGWGYLFGDEGGGFDIARQALRAALRYEEGWGPATSLREALLSSAPARDINDLMHRFYSTEFPRPRVAAFAKLVDRVAEEGDAIARDILRHAARQLAVLAFAVRQRLFEPSQPARMSYLGGVFRSRILMTQFRELIEAEPDNQLAPPVYGPAAGALLEAYRAAEIWCTLSALPEEKP
ncbi:MAG TPA: BadF/BadG/BcrA/BcrD ATPase family protein [Bryobacteraceae bacterium]|nr:BadF/BadG/BcrA/BcrD ATPase family protein [Bryobacteraceae bacterium]